MGHQICNRKDPNQVLETLYEIASVVSSSLDLAEIMELALDKVLSITDLDAGSIYLWNPEEALLKLSVYRGVAEEFAEGVTCFRLGESLIGQAALLRETVVVHDLENDPRVSTHLVSKGNFQSFISVPICCRNNLLGTINLASRHSHFFSAEEIEFYTGISNTIGMALHNGCLFAEEKKMAKSLQKSEERLRIVAAEQQQTIELLNRIGQAMSVKELAEIVTGDLKKWLDMEAVGIRIKEGKDYPYYETSGFSEAFVLAETHLCTRDLNSQLVRDEIGNPILECMCGNILSNTFDPSLPFFTHGGSFWTNSTSALLATTNEADRQARTRNRCNGEGYESVALIPLKTKQEIFGLIQLNDSRKDRFTPDLISLLERITNQLTMALGERKALEALQRSESLLKTAESLGRIGGWEWDVFKQTMFWTDQVYTIHGLIPGDIEPGAKEHVRCSLQCYAPEDREIIQNAFLHCEKAGDSYDFEFPFTPVKGDRIWVRTMAKPVLKDGRVIKIIGNIMDITDRKQMSDTLRESEKRYRILFQNLTIGFALHEIITDRQGKPCDYRFLEVNPAFEKLTGLKSENVIGRTVLEILPATEPFWIETYGNVAITGESIHVEHYSNAMGRHFAVTAYVTEPRQFATIFQDITSELDFVKRSAQAQKMEAIGSLAGGIAHDFNNILFPIKGLAEMMLWDEPEGSPYHENMKKIHQAATRAGDLVKQILTFSRRTVFKKIPISIQPILKEVVKLVRSTIPSNIDIATQIQTDCGKVLADPTQLHQIVMNLITNAYHAVETCNGNIRIELAESFLDRDKAKTLSLDTGKYARICIADTGHGIDPAIMDKIFDPYFTTKPDGKGTGLGLAVVHGIVKDMAGDICVDSRPGKETRFNIYLPLLEKDRDDAEEVKVGGAYQKGFERILLVDDEEPILSMEQKFLSRLGYHVTVRMDSQLALADFRANPDQYDLIITDMAMPKLTGDELSRRMLDIRPDIPIILCTGFSESIDEERAKAIGIRGFALKPLSTRDLSNLIHNVLKGSRG